MGTPLAPVAEMTSMSCQTVVWGREVALTAYRGAGCHRSPTWRLVGVRKPIRGR